MTYSRYDIAYSSYTISDIKYEIWAAAIGERDGEKELDQYSLLPPDLA